MPSAIVGRRRSSHLISQTHLYCPLKNISIVVCIILHMIEVRLENQEPVAYQTYTTFELFCQLTRQMLCYIYGDNTRIVVFQ